MKQILSYLPMPIKKIGRPIYQKFRYRKQLLSFVNTNKKKIRFILINSPEHGNLGDQAIAEAEVKFLHDYFPKIPVIELTGPHYHNNIGNVYEQIRKTDIILVTGGGNLGSLWMFEENILRDILHRFPDNHIIIFPQTIYFEETKRGREEFLRSYEIYGSHTKLTICLRERNSYNYVLENLDLSNGMKVLLIPDMALYIDISKYAAKKRNGVLLCLRNDKESILEDTQKQEITEYLRSRFDKITKIDTVVNRQILPSNRNNELKKIFNKFSSSELVVTDRLHAMIFATITGTPCIAMNQLSKKVEGVYELIKHLNYVRFVESLNSKAIAESNTSKSNHYDCKNMRELYRPLIITIEEALRSSEHNLNLVAG